MAITVGRFLGTLNRSFLFTPRNIFGFIECRCFSSLPNPQTDSNAQEKTSKDLSKTRKSIAPLEFRFIYPEFLPDPDVKRRNYIREKLERIDMMNRRTNIDLPEFYVGSILSVVSSDPHSLGKTSKFVGICIKRVGCGLRAEFTLRNVIDHQGIEIRYMMYDPTIQQIQVLRLEKRLDDKLYYLRDAPAEYSTFSMDMEPEILPEGAEVPVNKLQVRLKPRPWLERYERQDLKGVIGIEEHLKAKDFARIKKHAKPWEKYDLMKQYRATIPEQEQSEIWSDVYSQLHQLEIMRRKMARKRTFIMPKKSG